MEVFKLDEVNLEDLKVQLEIGKVLVFPTETAYGLVADSTNEKAVEKIYKIKGRSYEKALPVVCSGLDQVENFFILEKEQEKIVKKYWPGPLSIKLFHKGELKVNKNDDSVVVRVTAHKSLKNLVEIFSKPLVATSANLARSETLYDSKDVNEEFRDQEHQPDLLIDAGVLEKVEPSTIIEVEGKKIKILRPGPIKFD